MKKILGFVCGLMVSLLVGTLTARADAVLDWNAIAVNTAVANKQNPFAQARYAAIVQLAVFEAVNSITHKYQPYLGTITAPADASPDAAAIEAAYQVLSTYFPASQDSLYRVANSMSVHTGRSGKTDGIATGDAAAAAMIALRANDGSSPAQFYTPGPPVPGEWQATASCPIVNGVAVGIAFQWQNITPFGISSASDFLLDPPPALTSEEYAKAYNEVMTVGEYKQHATAPRSGKCSAVLRRRLRQLRCLIKWPSRSLWHRAVRCRRMRVLLALINMAMSDSLVASFLNKYFYNFWRPETAIHAGDSDGNPKTTGDPTGRHSSRLPVFQAIPQTMAAPQRRGGDNETPVRRRWTFDHVDESCRAHHRLAIHFVQADHR